MFKAITLAAALTLAEAARSKTANVDHDTRPPQSNLGCNEDDVSGIWNWNGGDKDGDTIELKVKDLYAEEEQPGNAGWTFLCTLKVDIEGVNHIFHVPDADDGTYELE